MTQLSGYCTNCGSEIEGRANFSTRCGARTVQDDVAKKSNDVA